MSVSMTLYVMLFEILAVMKGKEMDELKEMTVVLLTIIEL